MTTCNVCSAELSGKYCANCGQAAGVKRIDGHYIYHELVHLFHVEKGFFYTVKELLIRPGDTIREFITKDRSRHVKPIVFAVIAALIAKLVSQALTDEPVADSRYEKEFGHAYTVVLQWIGNNTGYTNLIYGFLLAFPVLLTFRRYKFNLFELMVLMSYLLAQGSLFYVLFGVLFAWVDTAWFKSVLGSILAAYLIWGVGQFFDKHKPIVYLKAALALVLGYVFWQLLIILICYAVDYGVSLFGGH